MESIVIVYPIVVLLNCDHFGLLFVPTGTWGRSCLYLCCQPITNSRLLLLLHVLLGSLPVTHLCHSIVGQTDVARRASIRVFLLFRGPVEAPEQSRLALSLEQLWQMDVLFVTAHLVCAV